MLAGGLAAHGGGVRCVRPMRCGKEVSDLGPSCVGSIGVRCAIDDREGESTVARGGVHQ